LTGVNAHVLLDGFGQTMRRTFQRSQASMLQATAIMLENGWGILDMGKAAGQASL
jgi:hypothetical protein